MSESRAESLTDEPERGLGKRIQAYRQLAGLTQAQLAARTALADRAKRGLSGAVISGYERGANRPGLKELRLICDALRVTPNVLLYGDEDPFEIGAGQARVEHWAITEPGLLAAQAYCFARLHRRHKEAIMQLMVGLLSGSHRNLEADMHRAAADEFVSVADRLKRLQRERTRV